MAATSFIRRCQTYSTHGRLPIHHRRVRRCLTRRWCLNGQEWEPVPIPRLPGDSAGAGRPRVLLLHLDRADGPAAGVRTDLAIAIGEDPAPDGAGVAIGAAGRGAG